MAITQCFVFALHQNVFGKQSTKVLSYCMAGSNDLNETTYKLQIAFYEI